MTTRHEFLKALFEFCGGDLELRAIQDGKEPHRTFCKLGDHKAVDGFCKAHPDRNIYFTIATRNNGGTKDHIQDIPALWCDLDFKNTPKQDADKRLADFPLKMSFCIASGHGYHCYWQLKEPYGKDDIPAIEALLKQLAASLHGDTAATDASRVLRLPDTANVKDPKIPKPVKCILARDLKYDLSDFDFLPDAAQECDLQGSTHINCTHTLYRGVTNSVTNAERNKRNISFSEGNRDETLFHLANYLVKGGMPRQDIETYIHFVASKCDPPFTKKETKTKIKSAFKRSERKKTALTAEIREWIGVTKGWFSVTNAQHDVTSVTYKDRAKLRVILSRLVKEGLIERHESQDGLFRRIEKEADEIDFMEADTDPLPIRWPFGIESLVEIMPGNLAIVAGEIEAGKTAFLLNLAKLNMHEMETHYFSSEMAGGEMRKRLQKFDDLVLSEWTFKAHARAGAFHDVIAPNALNIVDFIEVHDEFYKIGHYLKRIHDKLSQGVAVVALQKPQGRDTGLGGDRSMEVARLYLSLSKEYPGGRLKIAKGKNWTTEQNPNGLSIRYKIVKGATLIQQGDWARQ